MSPLRFGLLFYQCRLEHWHICTTIIHCSFTHSIHINTTFLLHISNTFKNVQTMCKQCAILYAIFYTFPTHLRPSRDNLPTTIRPLGYLEIGRDAYIARGNSTNVLRLSIKLCTRKPSSSEPTIIALHYLTGNRGYWT